MMNALANDPPLYLASTSPRRAKLLRDAGLTFEQIAPPLDDATFDLGPTPPARAAEALAYVKATAVADQFDRGIVIGSDTVIAHDGRRIGKPRDIDHARAMLTSLFGRPHMVITGVAIYDAATHHRMLFHDQTQVHITPPDGDAFEAYLAAGEWRGKAGGYNLAELENRWNFEVTGDPTTVIGLPMRLLARRLEQFHATHGVHPA